MKLNVSKWQRELPEKDTQDSDIFMCKAYIHIQNLLINYERFYLLTKQQFTTCQKKNKLKIYIYFGTLCSLIRHKISKIKDGYLNKSMFLSKFCQNILCPSF
jgi:hypothetical protein